MKFLNYMRVSPLDEWLNVSLECRKKNILELKGYAEKIRKSYEEYQDIIENIDKEIEPTKFEAEKDLLIDYYSAAPAEISRRMRLRRSDSTLHECPYCGYPFIPDTLDHFIPKDHWPEYSFLADNLVPQCRGCAPTKGSDYFCEKNNSAKFIHPYYSDLMSKIIFVLDLNMVNKNPIFSTRFKTIEKISKVEVNRIGLHIENLKIRTRLIDYSLKTFNHWLDLTRKTGCDISIAFNQRLIEKGGIEQHSTSWDQAFYKAILGNEEALRYFFDERGNISKPKEVLHDLNL